MTQTSTRRVRNAVLLALVLSSPLAIGSAADQQGGGHLQPCAATDFTSPRLFDVMPVDLSGVMGIVPLGSVSPPSHILPVHVLYFFTPYTFGADGQQIIPNEPDQPIRVPGDVTVTGVRWERNSGTHLVTGDDWYVNFRPCNEIRFTYHHLNAITGPPRLVARAAQIRRGVNAVCDVDASGEPVACTGIADVRLSAGDQVGTVFRLNLASFNLSATDQRAATTNPLPPPGQAVDPTRYELGYAQIVEILTAAGIPIPREFTPELAEELGSTRTQARCPLDYFEPALRSAFEAKLGSFDGTTPRLVPPRCGQFFQDSLSGGLRGGWFPEGLTTPFLLGGEEIVVGFLYGNVLPGRMYFSIGASVAPALDHSITFPYPGFDDNVTWRNVSFAGARYQSALPPDGQPLYCWDGLGATTMIGSAASPPSPVPGVMLVQFESPTQIRFEYAAAQTCAARSFTSAAQVFVR